MDPPVILFFAADPDPIMARSISFDQEARAIESAMERGGPHRLRLRPRLATTKEDIVRTLAGTPEARIAHFSMHGGPHGLSLADDKGRIDRLTTDALKYMLDAAPNLDLAVFNVCDGLMFAEACRSVVRCAVGARGQIENGPAQAFAGGFYTALAHGRTIEHALKFGRAQAEAKYAGSGDAFELVTDDPSAAQHHFATEEASPLPPPIESPQTTGRAEIVVLAGPSLEDTVRALCARLEPPTFFAPMAVDYGEAGDDKLYEAIRGARIFVVVSSGRRDLDWYHQDSIQEAIHAVRRSKSKRVVPVYLYGGPRDVEADFGLRRIKPIYGAEVGGVPGIARTLNDLYTRTTPGRTPHPDGHRRPVTRDEPRPATTPAVVALELAALYPTDGATRLLWQQAGGDPSTVPEISRPKERWSHLIMHLTQRGVGVTIERLAGAALADFPHNAVLLGACRR